MKARFFSVNPSSGYVSNDILFGPRENFRWKKEVEMRN
jgi:hypothetical protein